MWCCFSFPFNKTTYNSFNNKPVHNGQHPLPTPITKSIHTQNIQQFSSQVFLILLIFQLFIFSAVYISPLVQVFIFRSHFGFCLLNEAMAFAWFLTKLWHTAHQDKTKEMKITGKEKEKQVHDEKIYQFNKYIVCACGTKKDN